MFWFHIRTTHLFIISILIVNFDEHYLLLVIQLILITAYHSLNCNRDMINNLNRILKWLLDNSYCSSNVSPCTCWWHIVWMNHRFVCITVTSDTLHHTLDQLHKVFSMYTNTFHCRTFKVVRINKEKSNDSAKTKWFEL